MVWSGVGFEFVSFLKAWAMSDPILVRSGDGSLIYLQRNAQDRTGRQSSGTGADQGAGGKARVPIEDIVDISAGLRAADVIRTETDPDKIREKVAEGRKTIDSNISRFFSLFGFGTSSASTLSPLSRFIGALGLGDSSPYGASGSSTNTLTRLAGMLFGRGNRRRF